MRPNVLTRQLAIAAALVVAACGQPTSVFPEHYTLDPSVEGDLRDEVRDAFADWCERTEGLACATELAWPATEAHSVPVLVKVVDQAELDRDGFEATWAVMQQDPPRMRVRRDAAEARNTDVLRHLLRHEIGHACLVAGDGHLVDDSPGEVLMSGGHAWLPVVPGPAAPLGIDDLSLSAFLAECAW
jgi:hypothetical protein